jgi:hypothetical protein
MKRSSSLSALILVGAGLSVTCTSLAFAAPLPNGANGANGANDAAAPAKSATKRAAPSKKAKAPPAKTVQPTEPAATEGGGAAPAPAPAEPAPAAPASAEPEPAAVSPAATPEPGPTPAISIGSASGNPAVDAPSGAAVEPGAKPKARPWAGTQIFATSSMTTATVFKGQNQYSNPTVDGSIWLQPRYAISEAFQLRGLLIFSYEFTNSDETVTKNEPRFSDTTLQLFYRKIPELPGGIKPALALNMTAPTSPESRARTMVVTPGLTAQFVKAFEHVLGGEVDIIAFGTYSHPLYRDTTPEIRSTAPYAFQCLGGTSCQDQLGGTFNVSDAFRYAMIISGEWGKWSPALFYSGTSSWAYQGKEARNPVDGSIVQSPQGFAPTNVRQGSYFSGWLDYNANSWLTAEVGYSLQRSTLDGQGNYGNPFFDRYQDQRVFIGASFNIDNIMKQLEGGPTEAGIVRAQNKAVTNHM